MKDEWKVGRVIARPFIGKDASTFKRTPRRHDYALSPFKDTALDILKNQGFNVISVGKIYDIFNGKGITSSNKTVNNDDGMDKTIEICKDKSWNGLLFVNLVDFDMDFGHRRDVEGYGRAIERFDERLGELLKHLDEDDFLMLTADHGNDPTHKGTDHTRETVPLIVYSPKFKEGRVLPPKKSFGTVGVTIINNFNLSKNDLVGESILKDLK